MKALILLATIVLMGSGSFAQDGDSLMIRKMYDLALDGGHTYQDLKYLCKEIGPRLSGSVGAAKAVAWTKRLMEDYGFDTVYLQEVTVPHWERGENAIARLLDRKVRIAISAAALGGSIATPPNGITANLVEVKSFEELRMLGAERVRGKIVFFNRPMNRKSISTLAAYRGVSALRSQGAIEAAKLGAVAVIVRSLTTVSDDHPHTGAVRYSDVVPKIPAAAISTRGADLLSEKIASNKDLQLYFKQNCRQLSDAKSFNVIGEIKGKRRPDEIITIGAHLDSWDLGEGAHDDGAGVVQSVEVLRIFKALGYKPDHTIRVVLFMNEENGNRGGQMYAEIAEKLKEKHIFAIEADGGGFTPRGFSVEGNASFVDYMQSNWADLLSPYGLHQFEEGEGGTDIGPLKRVTPNVILIGFQPDNQRYFDIHHSANDVFENVNRRELELGAASMAALIYLIDSDSR